MTVFDSEGKLDTARDSIFTPKGQRKTKRASLEEEELAEIVKVTPLKEIFNNVRVNQRIQICHSGGLKRASIGEKLEEKLEQDKEQEDVKSSAPLPVEESYFADFKNGEQSWSTRYWRRIALIAVLLFVAKRFVQMK